MPDKVRPSERMLQHIGLLLVPEADWRSKITGWLLPVYYTIDPADVERIGAWRARYRLKSWRVGIYQPMIKRVKHPMHITKRFSKQGGDLARAATALRNLTKIKQHNREK